MLENGWDIIYSNAYLYHTACNGPAHVNMDDLLLPVTLDAHVGTILSVILPNMTCSFTTA
jgi:hypothetical protein